MAKPQSKAPKSVRRRKKAGQLSPPKALISKEDEVSLSEFCKGIAFDEISFDDWQTSLESLTICVPVWISAELALTGGSKTVNFMRRILNSPESGILKERVQLLIQIPSNAFGGQFLTINAEGDRSGSQTGDLIVTIYIKAQIKDSQ